MKTKRNNRLAILALSAMTPTAFAQNAPYATGPQHPMSAPLPLNCPFARVDPRLDHVPPVLPTVQNKPVLHNEAVDYNPRTRETIFEPALESGPRENVLMPGHTGSVDLSAREGTDGTAHVRTIFGADERQVISNASAFPWRANAELVITFKDGAMEQGSCTIVNAKYALTAGHCVYSSAHGGWAKSIQVMPGRSGSYLPYGSAWVTYMRSYTGWTNSGNNQYDLALVTLDRNIGLSTGWFGYGWWSNLNGVMGYLSAYDADKSVNFQKYRYGTIAPSTLSFSYMFDTYPGCSGGGVYRTLNGDRYCMGVNNWQYNNHNMGVRITSARFNDISGWIASGQ